MKNTAIKLSCLSVVLLLSACATTSQPALKGQLDSQFGRATQANIAAHAVAPTAAQKANTYIPADPFRSALARKNYRDNKVPDPVPAGP